MADFSALGKSMLREWYDAAKIYPGNFNIPFDDLVTLLQNNSNGTFLQNFGGAVDGFQNIIGLDAIRKNMRDLAASTQGLIETYPDGAPRSSFWSESIQQVADPSLLNPLFLKKLVPEVAEATISAAGSLAFAGLGIYVLGAGLALGFFLYASGAFRKGSA